MGRNSTVRTHPQLAEIELRLAAPMPNVPQLAREFHVSKDALYRHRLAVIIPRLRAELAMPEQAATTELLARMVSAADDQHLVRKALLDAGELAAHSAAVLAEAKILDQIFTKLGVDNTTTIELAVEQDAFARAVGRAMRADPSIAGPILDQLRDDDSLTGWAAAIEKHVFRNDIEAREVQS